MTKLLITGDTGLLGAALAAESCQTQSHETFGVSRAASDTTTGWDHRSVDLTDAATTQHYLNDVRPDFIIHCAAATDVDQCETRQAHAWTINVDATERLARWAAKNGARLTFISTDSVFDGALGGYREGDTPGPLNHYARTKLAGECVAALWSPNSLIVRTNFYGWNVSGRPNLAKWMYGKLLRGEQLRAFADVYFSPLFANDLARVILDLVWRRAKGVFHVASQDSCSKYEFAFLLGREVQLDTERIQSALVEDFRLYARRPKNTSLATSKCAQFLGREMPTLEQGMRAFARSVASDGNARFERRQGQPPLELTSH